jgi:hypothetical protein
LKYRFLELHQSQDHCPGGRSYRGRGTADSGRIVDRWQLTLQHRAWARGAASRGAFDESSGRRKRQPREQALPAPPQPAAPAQPEPQPVKNAVVWHVDKSALPLSEPRRYRDRAHLEFVASQPCLVCGRQPSDAHHLRFMQARALGRRVSDEFAVPLCRTHHRAVHRSGDEAAWWKAAGIDAVAIAHRLWQHTRLDGAPIQQHLDPLPNVPSVPTADDGGAKPSTGSHR